MTPDRAWQRGLQVLRRYPWLALIPMGWNLAQIALAWCGIPLGPMPDVALLADRGYQALVLPQVGNTGAGFSLRAFLPSWLPSVTDLQIPIQPESLAMPVGVSTPAILLGQLLVPVLDAVATATYLVLVAQVVTRGEPNRRMAIRQVMRAVPGLYIVGLLWHLAFMLLSRDALLVTGVLWFLLFPLLSLIIVAGDRPLLAALREAPQHLWGRFGAWCGVGWRTLLTTALVHLAWAFTGRSLVLGMLIYPFAATWTVGAGAALYLVHTEDEIPASAPVAPARWPVAIGVALLFAWGTSALAGQWAGYRVTREAALDEQFPPFVVHIAPEGESEWVLYRHGNRTGIARLQFNRFGWKRFWHQEYEHRAPQDGRQVQAILHWSLPDPSYGQYLLWGEVLDSRVAAVGAAGITYVLTPGNPLFVIPVAEEPAAEQGRLQNLRFLDASGEPLPGPEVLHQ